MFYVVRDLAGHCVQLFPICYLIGILIWKKSCGSISGKTQLLLAITSTARYEEIYTSPYNNGLRWIYLVLSYTTILLIFVILRKTYRQKDDTFMTELLLVPSLLIGVCFKNPENPKWILQTFSSVLEPLAMLPQLYMIYNQRTVEKSLLLYVTYIGLLNTILWIYPQLAGYDVYYTGTVLSLVYVIVYACALIGFFTLDIKVTDDAACRNKTVDKNPYLTNNHDFENEMVNDEKKVAKVQLLPSRESSET